MTILVRWFPLVIVIVLLIMQINLLRLSGRLFKATGALMAAWTKAFVALEARIEKLENERDNS